MDTKWRCISDWVNGDIPASYVGFRGTYLGAFDCLAGEVIFTMLGTISTSCYYVVGDVLSHFQHGLNICFFPKDVSSQGSSEDCWRISHHTYPTHIQHILHIPHISISNVSTTHIPHISSTLHISHTYPFQTYPTHTYPISTYPCNAYPFKRL